MATAEFSPLVHTGGLGDAVAGLTGALAGLGVEITVVLPAYAALGEAGEAGAGVGPAERVRKTQVGEIPVWLVDDPPSFGRDGIYGPQPGTAYADEWRRWGRFAQAVAGLAGDFDLVHCHDSQLGLVPHLTPVPCVFTVHNAGYPLTGPLDQVVEELGLPSALAEPLSLLEFHGLANYLKAGLIGAVQATTVSPGYARELALDEEVASGLDGVIRQLKRPLRGILNGIDTERFDPARDPDLPKGFDVDELAGRTVARQQLVDRIGMDGSGMLFGMVGRLTHQKGIELIDSVIDPLVEEGMRLVVMGSGEEDSTVRAWSDRHPGAVVHMPFERSLARLISAGCDAALMPSRFEPGGLANLYAMRYGCVPVVRLTGGLADSVIDEDEAPGQGNGFGFRAFLAAELAKTVRRAMRYHQHLPGLWEQMQRRGMAIDWSWQRAAVSYRELYASVLGTPGSG